MKTIPSIQFFCTFFITFCHASESTLELYQQGKILYRKAVSEDVPYITALINEKAHLDNTKVVVLPKKFREPSIMSAVEKQKLYIAESFKDDIIGFKELFVITDPAEYYAITRDEIRCEGPKSNPVYYQRIFMGATAASAPKCIRMTNEYPPISKDGIFFALEDSIVIYLGDDYTHPNYRNHHGINWELTCIAFNLIKKEVYSDFARKINPTKLILLYARECRGTDRTLPICHAFIKFIEEIITDLCYKNNRFLYHVCYHSFMPTFDPESEECIPLAHEYAVAGYGNALIFPLEKNYR